MLHFGKDRKSLQAFIMLFSLILLMLYTDKKVSLQSSLYNFNIQINIDCPFL